MPFKEQQRVRGKDGRIVVIEAVVHFSPVEYFVYYEDDPKKELFLISIKEPKQKKSTHKPIGVLTSKEYVYAQEGV